MQLSTWILDSSLPNCAVCHVTSSELSIVNCDVISNAESSPFIVMKSILNRGSSVRLVSTTHKTSSSFLLPFVGICPSFLDNVKNSYSGPEHKDISIIGESISLTNQHLVKGTSPLFAFGLGDITPTPTLLGQQLATTLTSASLVNVTSSPIFKPSDSKTFGSLLSQMAVSCKVTKSTNHDCGALFLDPNLGGNLVCVNSSFSSCIRQSNSEELYTHRNMTQSESHTDRIVFGTSSTATSVTVTSCTFNTMSVGFGWTWGGGAAIFLYASPSSLNISQCSFHKCSVTKADDDGGAVLFYCSSTQSRPIDVSSSSFTECTTAKISTNAAAGIIIGVASSAVIQDTIFERCKAQFDACIYIEACLSSTFTNCFFLSCEGAERTGGCGSHNIKAIDYSYLHFRDCWSPVLPFTKDLCFTNIPETATFSIQYCDSTSGAPNVFDYSANQDASDLVPQLTSTSTVSGATVLFSADKQTATVTVTTEQALSGTMGVLLDGSNVPRMVYVVFGTSSTVSRTATVTVSSGPDGVLPEATYVHRASAIPGNIPKQVHHTSTALTNANTTTITLSGYGLENGDYVMTVDNDGTEQNITLAWMDANTLSGSAQLYPSTAPGRLDYGKIYPIVRVVFDPLSKQENVRLLQDNSFTTPTQPSRVTKADCSLNGKKDGVVVRLIGTKLFSNGQKVKIGSGGLIESTGTIFSVSLTECYVLFSTGWFGDGRQTIFGSSYEIFSVGSGSDSFAVDSGVSFTVLSPPQITTISVPPAITSSSFTLSFGGSSLPSGSTYTVTLNTSDTFDVTFSSATSGSSSSVKIGVSGGLKYNTLYSIVSMIKTEENKPDEHILLSSSSFTTPIGPSLSLVASSLSPSDPNVVRLSLSTILMPSEQFTLVLTSTASPSKTVSVNITFSSTQPDSPTTVSTIDVEVYNRTNTLEYETEYSIESMTSSNVVAYVSASTFTTPLSPSRVENVSCSLGGTFQKSAILVLTGVRLESPLSFDLIVQEKKADGTLSGTDIKLSGVLSGSSSSTCHTFTVPIFGEENPLLSYETSYGVTDFVVPGRTSLANPSISFSVLPEPSRLTMIEATPVYSEDEKSATVSLFGVKMAGQFMLTLSINSNLSSTVEIPASFDVNGNGKCVGTLFDSLEPSNVNLFYNTSYTVVGVMSDEGSVFIEQDLEFSTMAEPTRVMNITRGEFVDTEKTTVDLSFVFVAAEKSSEYTFAVKSIESDETPAHATTFTVESDENGETKACRIGLYGLEQPSLSWNGQLKFEKEYEVVSVFRGSDKIHFEKVGTRFSMPEAPSRVTDADCSLNGKKDEVVVRLIGTKLFSNGQKVKIGSGGLIESTGTIFSVSLTECYVLFSTGWFGDGRQTIFGSSYEIFSVGSGSDSFAVDSGVSFTVLSPPQITTISVPPAITSSSFTLSFGGSSLPSGSTYTVTLNTSDTFDVTFSSATSGSSSSVKIGVSGGLKYNTLYSIVSMIKTEENKPDEHILLSSSSFTTPIGPSLSLVASSLSPSDPNVVRLSLSTILMPSEQFTLVLTSTASPSKTVSVNITFSSTQPASPPTISTIDVEVYNQTSTLEYETEYSIESMTSSNVVAVVTAPDFTTPNEPPRVQSFENSRLNLTRTELSFELVGRALKTGLGKVALKRDGFLLESVSPIGFINDTHSSGKFLVGETESSSRLAYGTEYTLTTVEGDISGLVVDPGIIVRAPNPAKVTKMEIDFSNSAKTGCIVRLNGADLVPGTIYSATLTTPQQPPNHNSDSSSVSFDISFSSTAEGESQPIKIGWRDENNLEYSRKYTLTSLTPSVAEDGAIIFDNSLSDTTGTKPAESFFYVDSLSSDSSPFCGDRDSPCQSIDSAWMIVLGVSLTRPTLGIVDHTTLSTPISISNNMHVVIMNGTSSEPKLNVSSLTSQPADEDNTMITVKDSFLELLNVDVVLASLSQSFVFVSASDSTIVFRDGSFLGSTSPPTSTQNEADSENLCSWSSGIIQIADCTTSITNTQLTHLVFGAVNMKGGDLTIQTTTFSDNSPSNSSFPSASRNIHCSENGKIEIVSQNGGDGTKDHPSGWISSEDCVLSGRDSTPKTPLFIPTLDASKSTSTRDKKTKTIKFTIIGTMLIPCGLLAEVFEWNADTQTEGTKTIVELNENTNLWTEEQIDGIIDETKDLLNLSETSDWRLRLVFGDEVRTDTSIVLRTVASDRKALFGQAVKWMIPLIVAVVLIAMFLVILLVVLLRRRKKGKQKQSELKEIDEFVEEMKIEDPTMEGTDRLNCSAFDTPTESNHNNTHITARNETEKDQKFEEDVKEDQAAGEFALVTLSNGSEVRILKKDTLYNRLHNPQMKDTHLDFDSVRKQIISGLLAVRKRDRSSAILLQLSPHLVFFDAAGVACLNCSQHPQSEMEIVGHNGLSRMGQNQPQDLLELPDKQNQLQMETANNEQDNAVQATEGTTLKTLPSVNLRKVNEGDRWRAPEVTRMIEEYAQNGSHTQTEAVSRNVHLDHSAAAVFSLGLILWEIETNQIPFGEVDAVNAQRQLGSGQRPGMEKVHSEWMASVIEQCLEYEPAKRIKLEHLESLLCGPSQHKPSQPFALDQVPFVNHHELQPLP
ncbi:hypothetical protein BLNAU_4220 [Blattamonas nauphoetae]|uniref:Protein kinase domain-containing protein n=1 Tax=Blattamonas nauphoetae TaxID=2049346 RepID=A0ABQ9YAL8_9EUKA|nr:hypothetical protein BLNAU_4220 [Blattamonas nauphoetae]